jgi:predicted nucleic acid-binding protein
MIRSIADSNSEISVSAISYVEMHSAISRRSREGSLGNLDMEKILKDFEADWNEFGKIHLDEFILKRAGKLCLIHPIRSLDAVQLATALTASENQEEPLLFLTADKRLEAAAEKEKLVTHV